MNGRDGPSRQPSVALVSMPFHRCLMPPIGLGLLKSALSAAGLPSTVYNLNLDLLPEMGSSAGKALEVDGVLAENVTRFQLGDWLFSPAGAADDERYLAVLGDCGISPDVLALLRRLRSRAGDLLEGWARRLTAAGHDIVGFSASMGRTRACVSLAEAIRRKAPGTRIVLGGFSVTGDMGVALMEAFPVVDLVCHAEADDLIVPIVRALRGQEGATVEGLTGVTYRKDGTLVTRSEGFSPPEMERTPLPDYDDYFEEVRGLKERWDAALGLPFYLPFEAARGCWWGDHCHCAFCSLNGERLAFRSKSAGRVLSDLDRLHARYGVRRFVAVDNVLDRDYFTTLLPRLTELRRGYVLEWEVRPNLTPRMVASLARAGFSYVQPGIESLSTPALRAMSKGTTAIENVQTMKWLAAYQVKCSWNFLFSLPGERLEWYEEMAPSLPRLMHLHPPHGPSRIALQRYSPLFTRARELGIRLLGPTFFARLAFPDVPEELLARLAYDVDFEIEGRPGDLDERICQVLEPLLSRWRERFEANGCTLSLVDGPGEALLVEGPLLWPERIFRLAGLLRSFLKGCESIQQETGLLRRLEEGGPGGEPLEPPLEPRSYRKVVDLLCATGVRPEEAPAVSLENVVGVADSRGWVLRESGRILCLPVDQTHYVKTGPFQLEVAYRTALGEASA